MLRALMPVVCVDTALYTLTVDYYHSIFPLRTLHSWAYQMHPERVFWTKLLAC